MCCGPAVACPYGSIGTVWPWHRASATWAGTGVGWLNPKTREDWAAYTSAGVGAGVNASAVELYWHIGLLWGLCVSTGALQSSHVDDPDTRHMWTMLQSLLSEAGEASSWRRR